MRLVKYINEAEVDDHKLIEQFHKDTSQFHKEMKGVRVWRATNKRINQIEKLFARTDRRPKDTPTEIHNWFDDFFKKKFGWKARSEGVFASSTPTGIETFGRNVYLMFPCNGYKYVWSPTIQDLTQYASQAWSLIDYDGMTGKHMMAWGWDDPREKAGMLKDMNTYTDKNLPKSSYHSTEIMFNCPNGYYMINGDFFRKYHLEIMEER